MRQPNAGYWKETPMHPSPTIEEAIQMAKEALKPRTTLQQWIDGAQFEGDITSKTSKFKMTSKTSKTSKTNYTITNAWLTQDGHVLVGGKHQTPWWNGRTTDAAMAKAKYALTRFVPGQEGKGGTDRIDSVIIEMQRSHTFIQSELWFVD